MNDADIIGPLLTHCEGQFPKACACGRKFATLREYIRDTVPIGDAISYDAASSDWSPTQPLGALALANCPCGSTLAVSTEGMSLETRHRVLAWIRSEMTQRGVTAKVVAGAIREKIRKGVLSDSNRP